MGTGRGLPPTLRKFKRETTNDEDLDEDDDGLAEPQTPDKPVWQTFLAPVLSRTSGLDFLTGGMLAFLPDCTHDLRGQTVPLPDVPAGIVAAAPEGQHAWAAPAA